MGHQPRSRASEPPTTGRYRRPSEVWVAAGFLFWPEREADWFAEEQPYDGRLLPSFLAIRTTKGVRDFAGRYGPLRLCERHSEPASHKRAPAARARRLGAGLEAEPECAVGSLPWPGLSYERVSGWIEFAEEARQLAWGAKKFATATHPSEWEQLAESLPMSSAFSLPVPAGNTFEFEDARRAYRFYFAQMVDRWLQLGRVRLQLSWWTDMNLCIAGTGLFGELAMRLTDLIRAAVNGAPLQEIRDPVICTGCGASFVPMRQPVAGRDRYCSICTDTGEAERVRKARQRARKRAYRASNNEEGSPNGG